MKVKAKKLIQVALFAFMCIFFTQLVPVSAANTVSVGTYGSTPIPEPYSHGTVQTLDKSATFSGFKNVGKDALDGGKSTCYEAKNTEINSNIYVIYKNAAYYDGNPYDLKVYYWCNNSNVGYNVASDGNIGNPIMSTGSKSDGSVTIYMEWHFLKNGQEVTFNGSGAFFDLDLIEGAKAEGIGFYNGIHSAMLSSGTHIDYDSSNGWFYGTKSEKDGDENRSTNPKSAVFFTFSSSPSSPFRLAYNSRDRYGTTIDSDSLNIAYKIVDSSHYLAGQTISNVKIARYGNFSVVDKHSNAADYNFYGWYSDAALTNKITSITKLSANTTVYGKYVHTWDITTSATNASVTASEYDIEQGNNRTVTWKANDGYYIDSVTIDGSSINVKDHSSGYSCDFTNISANHNVVVKALPYHKVTTFVEHGTITTSSDKIRCGDTKEITYSPNPGYYLYSLEKDGEALDVTKYPDGYSFVNVNEDHEIKAIYKLIPNLIITKNTDKEKYNYLDTVKYSIILDQTVPGAEAENVVITDENITKGMEIDMDSIEVSFGVANTKFTYLAEDNGFRLEIPSLMDSNRVVITFDAVVNNDVLASKDINNIVQVTSTNATPKEDDSPASVFYQVTTKVTNGTITESDYEIPRDEDRTFKYEPEEGYYLHDLYVDGNVMDVKEYPTEVTLPKIEENHEVEAVFVKIPALEIKKTSDKKVYHTGDTANFTIVASQTIEGATAENVIVTDPEMPVGFTLIKDSVKANRNNANITVDENGFVVTLDELTDKVPLRITFSATIDEDKVDLSEVENIANVKCENSTSTDEDKAEISIENKITTSVIHGNITPSVDGIKIHDNQLIEYSPEDGYYLSEIFVDGESVSIEEFKNNYSFDDIKKDHDIQVIYRKIPNLTITKTTDKKSYTTGETIKYTIVVTNDEDGSVAKNIKINDTGLTKGAKLQHYSILLDKDGTVTKKGKGFTVSLNEDLEYMDSVTITYEAIVTSKSGISDITNKVTAIADHMDNEVSATKTVDIVYPENSQNSKTPKKSTYKPVKTGDSNNMFILAIIGLASAFFGLSFTKR